MLFDSEKEAENNQRYAEHYPADYPNDERKDVESPGKYVDG